jgi:hypothetical protein
MCIFANEINNVLKTAAMKEMNVKSEKGYKINNVTVTTNGNKELYFDVEWEGDRTIDDYELRVFDHKRDCLECYACATHRERMTVKDFYMDLEPRKVNRETFYVELGVAEYDPKEEKLVSWKVLTAYEPIEMDIYYEPHLFRKTVMDIRLCSQNNSCV